MSSNAAKKEGLDADNKSDDSNSVSSGPENNDKQPCMRRSEGTSSTTNEPSSASASATATEVATAVARHPTHRSGLPTFADAAAAAAPTVPLKEKKPRRAGFREQFPQKLRVMLDRESQNDSSVVQWSADGNSFIITDQNQFEERIIPTYFDNPIVFASFLSKLYRWGFNRVSRSTCAGRYEFCSSTFKRLDAHSETAAAAAAVNTTGIAGGGAPIQVQQQLAQAFSSSLQQDVTAQTNQLLASNPLLTSQADANNGITDMISNLISNIQRQLSSQQPSITSQQFVLNQNTDQPNNADANSILQGIMSSNQQQLLSPHSTPSQQPVLNQSTNNPLNMNHNILQSFQERQHPNTTSNLFNTALSILAGGQAPSSAQLMGYFSPSSQSNAMQALTSLYGMMLPQPALTNTNISADMSQLLELVIQRVVGEEVQRRAQVDAIQNAVKTTIGQNTGQGGFPNNNIVQTPQQGIIPLFMQTLGSNNNNTAQLQQVGTPPPPPAGNMNIEAYSIAAILQAARRGDVAGQLEDDDPARNGPDGGDDEDDNNGGHEGRPVSPTKRKPPNDDQYDADDDRWNERLRPRKKSSRK